MAHSVPAPLDFHGDGKSSLVCLLLETVSSWSTGHSVSSLCAQLLAQGLALPNRTAARGMSGTGCQQPHRMQAANAHLLERKALDLGPLLLNNESDRPRAASSAPPLSRRFLERQKVVSSPGLPGPGATCRAGRTMLACRSLPVFLPLSCPPFGPSGPGSPTSPQPVSPLWGWGAPRDLHQQALSHGQNPGPRGLGGLPSVPRYQESLPLPGAAQLFPHLLPRSPLSGPPEGHLSHSTCAPAKPGGWTGVAVGRRGRGMHTSWPSQGPSPACPGCSSIHPLWPSLWEEKDLLLELEPPPQVAPMAPRHGSSVFQGLSLLTTCLECPWAVFSEPRLCVLLAWPGIPGPPLGSCGTWGKPMNLLAPGVLIWSRVVITVPPPPGPL